ncbi:MAG: hypothetical protein ACU841_03435 [Gammaproteobacteria bacterium]
MTVLLTIFLHQEAFMRLASYDKEGLLFITSVLGATSEKGIDAFRGDLVLKQGAFREGSTTDRKPPELCLHQAAILADNEKFIFVSGLFREMMDIPVFVDRYENALKPETVTLFFVENIAEPMSIEINGVLCKCLPYRDGMIWNETLDLLYLEKADLKGQSAEDKVVTVFDAAKSFGTKTPTIDLAAALGKTIVVKKEAAVGPV